MSGNLADRLQVWGFEGDFIIFSDGSLGFGLEVTPLDVSCWSDDRVNQLSQSLKQFLNGLPANLYLQFIQDIKAGNDQIISGHSALGRESQSPVAKALSEQRTQRLKLLESEGNIPKHTLKVFVRRPSSSPLLKKPTLLSKSGSFEAISEQRLEYEIGAVRQIRENLIQGARSMELAAAALTADEVTKLMYQQWNPTRPVELGAYDPEEIRGSILFTDAVLSDRGFALSDVHHRIVSLKLLPDETFSSMAATLRDLPFDSRLFLSIFVPDQHREIASLQTQRRLAFSMVHGKRAGVSDIDSRTKLEDLEGLLEQMVAEGEKVFHVGLSVCLRAKTEEELEYQVAYTLMKLRECNGAEGMEETIASFDIFSEVGIPNAKGKERSKRMKSSNLADFLPIYGPWSGHRRPSILLRSRLGSLVSFDPFAESLTNYNHVISGGSGSGKSFLTNILLLQMLKENPRIFIVDIGGSYRKLCENLSGQNVLLGADVDLSINPFDLAPDESVPSNHKIKFLVGLVELMTKEEGENRLPRLERAELEEAIQKVYEKTKPPKLSVLREILEGHPNTEIRRLGRILGPWCGNTPFGKFLDRDTTIQLSRPIVAFDLKGMETYPDLQAVSLYIITDFVWREIQKDRESKKFLIFDECWRLLENEAGASFIGEVFRTFRKYFAGAIAISQNVDDFAKSRVATAILSNSSVKWLLMQKGSDQKRLAEVLDLNHREMELISSLRQERGLYSEVFLLCEGQRALLAIEPTPLEYWIATTDPRDLACIEKQMNESPMALLEALRILAEKYPRGMAMYEK